MCPSAHRGRLWLSVCVRVCPSVSSAPTGRPWLSISTHISRLVLGLSTLALPVDSLCDFGRHGLSVQYTQDVSRCQPAHTGHPWLSVSTHKTSVTIRLHTQDVCGCLSARTRLLCWSVTTHRTSVAVRVCLLHMRRPWLSISTHISTLALLVDCSGDFGPRGLSVQYTQEVRGSPSEQTGRLWLSVSTHRTSMDVCVCPSAHTGRP